MLCVISTSPLKRNKTRREQAKQVSLLFSLCLSSLTLIKWKQLYHTLRTPFCFCGLWSINLKIKLNLSFSWLLLSYSWWYKQEEIKSKDLMIFNSEEQRPKRKERRRKRLKNVLDVHMDANEVLTVLEVK